MMFRTGYLHSALAILGILAAAAAASGASYDNGSRDLGDASSAEGSDSQFGFDNQSSFVVRRLTLDYTGAGAVTNWSLPVIAVDNGESYGLGQIVLPNGTTAFGVRFDAAGGCLNAVPANNQPTARFTCTFALPNLKIQNNVTWHVRGGIRNLPSPGGVNGVTVKITFYDSPNPSCTYVVDPTTTITFPAAGVSTAGSFIGVTTGSGCTWDADSWNIPWVTFTGKKDGNGLPITSGSGFATFLVASNLTAPPRSGTATVAGQTVNFSQSGCSSYSLSSLSVNVPATAGTGSVNVIAGAACTWTASSPAAFVAITGGASGTGNGTVAFSYQANPSSARNAVLSVAGLNFTVNQSAAAAPPAAPSSPNPGDGATGVPLNTTLSWIQSETLDSMDVYFGASNPPPLVANINVRSYTPVGLAGLTTYYWRVVAKRGGLSASSPVFSFTTAGTLSTGGLRFVPVAPCRLIDTRETSFGAFGSPALVGNAARSFAIPQKAGCNIPANASAYSLNVTVVPQGSLGFLTIFPTGVAQPFVSTLNSLDGRIKANAAIVPAGAGGAVSVFVTNPSELIVDINGYFIDPALNSQALSFYPLPPCRVADTRNANGTLGGPVLTAGSGRNFPILASNCGVPATAQAYSLNATVVPPAALGFLTLWPTGQGQPLVSTLNALTGAITANAAIVPAGTNGQIAAFVSSTSHLVLDINGYFAPPGAANAQRFYTVSPCRLADTRNATGEFGGPVLEASSARSYRLPMANCNLPGTAAAFSLNATVVPAASLGFLTLWPFGTSQPLVSTLNAIDGSITSNAAIVPAGTAGAVASFVTNQTHLVLDTNGYFAP